MPGSNCRQKCYIYPFTLFRNYLLGNIFLGSFGLTALILSVLKDVLGRIAKQSAELESHADRLYDSILTSLDLLAGCALTPENKPTRAKERQCERV